MYKLVEQQHQVQQDRQYVEVVPQACEVFASLLDHLSHFDVPKVDCATN